MRLLLIRHAESVRNVSMRGKAFYSDDHEKAGVPTRKVKLTELGEKQAQTLADRILRRVREGELQLPDIVLSSGFVRADNTAEIVIRKLAELSAGTENFNGEGGVIKHNHLLRERDPGYGFEMTEEESRAHFPYLKKYWELEGKWFSTPPGGESLVKVMDRASLLLQTLAYDSRCTNKTIYAFSHGGFMMAMRMVVSGISCAKADEVMKNPNNCHIDMYSNENGYWEATQ